MPRAKKSKDIEVEEKKVQEEVAPVEDANGNKEKTAVKARKPRATKAEMAERAKKEAEAAAKAEKANKKAKKAKAKKATSEVVPPAIKEVIEEEKADEIIAEEMKADEVKEEIVADEVKAEIVADEVKADENKTEEMIEEMIEEPAETKKKSGRPKKSQAIEEVKQVAKKAISKKATVKTNKNEAKTNKKEESYKIIEAKVVFQQNGYELEPKAILESAKEAWLAKGHKESEMKSIELYIKPEEWAAYYVVNGVIDKSNKIDLPNFS